MKPLEIIIGAVVLLTNFYADLTDRVRFDEENELRVIARNSDQPNSRWYSGAGIYRPVVLWTAAGDRGYGLQRVRHVLPAGHPHSGPRRAHHQGDPELYRVRQGQGLQHDRP